jgi:hypothetical protein
VQDGDESRWLLSGPPFSGLYEAQYEHKAAPSQTFAVNVDPLESDLARVDPDLLPSQFQHDLRADSAAPPKLPGGRPWPLFRLALGCVLALVLVETLLAWLFGKTSG